MRRDIGQSLSEYALIGGLIAIVAIPALMMIGDGINNTLSKSGERFSGNPLDYYKSTFNLANSEAPKLLQTPAKSRASHYAHEAFTGEGWQAEYDGESEEIHYAMPSSGSGGTNTASVSGVQHSASMTKSMSNRIDIFSNLRDDNGNPLPTELSSALRQLAQHGFTMSDYESQLSSFYERENLNRKGQTTLEQLAIYDQKFTTAFKSVQSLMNQPEYSGMRSQVNAYAGVVSTLAARNLTHWDNVDIEITAKRVGKPPKYVIAISNSANATRFNANKINNVADTTGAVTASNNTEAAQ